MVCFSHKSKLFWNIAYLEYILEPQGDQTCVKSLPKSKWPQLGFLTDFIRLTLIPACQLDQQDVINFTIFSLPFSFPPCIIQS